VALVNRVICCRRFTTLLGAAVLWAGALALPNDANAGFNSFCYANGNSILVGPQGYCVGNGYSALRQVRWSLTNGSGVSHCALSKFQSDGGGSNAHQPLMCGTYQHQYSECAVFPYGTLYPKGTNESNSSHYYYGTAAYGDFTCF
jgi:hypothetical protein